MNKLQLSNRLKVLYQDSSKHSRYQSIPDFVQEELNYSESINEEWRGDTARYQYISKYISDNKFINILDIGANTGFFTHSLAHDFPEISIKAIEPNTNHYEFIKEINTLFNMERIEVSNCSLGLDDLKSWKTKSDCSLLLNILHHAGGDFDQHLINGPESYWDYFERYISDFRNVSNVLILQVGYNWCGDKSKPIIIPDDILSMFESLVRHVINSGWNIQAVAYYAKVLKEYVDVPRYFIENSSKVNIKNELLNWMIENNVNKNSEFYKRPIIIIKH